MATRYLLWELNINQKFAREQKVSWEEKKGYIFKIFNEISEKNLFSSSDRSNSNYNILDNYEDSCSLCMYKLNGNGEIIKSKLLNNENTSITEENIEESKIKDNSFIFLFNLGLLSHKDATLLKDGIKDNLGRGKGHVQGRIYTTLKKLLKAKTISDLS